ncbi:MAG: transcription-repair coupling factor [Planctomycetaceae bacterium]
MSQLDSSSTVPLRGDSTAENCSLPDLVARMRAEPRLQQVLSALQRGESGTIDGAWGSACALACASLIAPQTASGASHAHSSGGAIAPQQEECRPLLVVLPRIADVDDFAVDLQTFLGVAPTVFPAWESLPTEHVISDQVFGARLKVLGDVESRHSPRVILASLPALLQPVPSHEQRVHATRTLRVGETLDLEDLLQWLVARGFERESAIERPGEFAVHGGILDVFPPDSTDPLRIELFGDEIDSIRTFDVGTQRKVEDLREARLTIIGPPDHPEGLAAGPPSKTTSRSTADPLQTSISNALHSEHFADLLPPGTCVALVELAELVEEGRQYLTRLDNPRGLFTVESTLQRLTQRPSVSISALTADSLETTCHLQVESIERFSGPKSEVLHELATIVGRDENVLIACHNEAERERLTELLANTRQGDGAALNGRVTFTVGSLTRGFRIVSQQLVVLSDHELFSRTEVRRTPVKKKRVDSRAIDSFLDLNPGDYVVHLTHGIGRYRGMELLDREGGKEEHLAIEFRDGVKIFVPVTLIHLVQKYIGAAKGSPTLSKVGGSQWGKQKAKVSEAVADMASDMLRLQAERESKPGLACPPDSHFQDEFEAAFPYTETEDQLAAIEAARLDQERPRPMDRLICGDVGFGKTEVAMRAAFKAVDAGRQVAVLVPTTILCEQHFRTFSDRMAEFPITIESLSRFKTKGEQNEILRRAAEGKVDILIGTHRLVQPDVRFKDLGLLVIDEEQRFGVDAKEMLKRLRLAVDVMTLSATPIPRTLHMSLLGIRDISNLTTPPQDRQAIETRICRWDGDLIRHAVVRELNRGGQVYFVHNRVYNIEEIKDRLQRIVPEARIIVGHGQMGDNELERAMLTFVQGKADILVATTIIESGLDIPTANTMFINQAQNYGLAEMHQLRGRVGRHRHRAYCYLLLDEKKPVQSQAAKRLKAIEEYSELGAGFKIAMRDLEIRGAGNILGTEQSGHITTVGYELYCQLLDSAVRRLQGLPQREAPHVNIELPLEAYLPNSYIPPGRQKIDVYRKISATASLEELAEMTAELRDRFGPIPPLAENLLQVRELQVMAFPWGIDGVRLETNPFSDLQTTTAAPSTRTTGGGRPTYAVFTYRDDQRIHDLAGHIERRRHVTRAGKDAPLASLRIVDHRNAYLLLPRGELSGLEIVQLLRNTLDPTGGTTLTIRSRDASSDDEVSGQGEEGERSQGAQRTTAAERAGRRETSPNVETRKATVPAHPSGDAASKSISQRPTTTKPAKPPRRGPAKNETPVVSPDDLAEAGDTKLRGLLKSRRKGGRGALAEREAQQIEPEQSEPESD